MIPGELKKKRNEFKYKVHQYLVDKDDALTMFFRKSLGFNLIVTYDGVILMANDTVCRTLGYTESELAGTNVIDYVHPDDVERTESELRSDARYSQNFDFTNHYVSRHGEIITINWRQGWEGANKITYAEGIIK